MAFEPNGDKPGIKFPQKAVVEMPPEPQPDISDKLENIMKALNDLSQRQRIIEQRIEPKQTRTQERQTSRERRTSRIVQGRNGEMLSRRHDDSIDPFELPPELVEQARQEGWDYEWKTENVRGSDMLNYQAKLHANGWRPVPSSRLPGVYGPENDEGPVRHDGMILMERPLQLTIDARADEDRKAREQVRLKHESWGVSSKDTRIFDPNTAMAKSFTISPTASVEPSDPSWRPTLPIASADDL